MNGKETLWRFREGFDPYVKAGEGVKFYGYPDGKAKIFALPYQPAAEMPDAEYDLWLCTGRVLCARTLQGRPRRSGFHESRRCQKAWPATQ